MPVGDRLTCSNRLHQRLNLNKKMKTRVETDLREPPPFSSTPLGVPAKTGESEGFDPHVKKRWMQQERYFMWFKRRSYARKILGKEENGNGESKEETMRIGDKLQVTVILCEDKRLRNSRARRKMDKFFKTKKKKQTEKFNTLHVYELFGNGTIGFKNGAHAKLDKECSTGPEICLLLHWQEVDRTKVPNVI
ncbi:hypothetical protein HPP92_007256 [Vanilla planifolia]|uniref:Uncharacterized protein n=1 Tax=Vanilla planifolia TaxID=51239 RepID=A0A835RH69_VANPL|nr:hypothetical protein HPP92_007256 [Vanilla planifolia]